MMIPALRTSTRLLLAAGFVLVVVACMGPALSLVSLAELRELNSSLVSMLSW